MRALRIGVGLLAFMLLLSYLWLCSFPRRMARWTKRVLHFLKDWGKAAWRMFVTLRWETPHPSGERDAWFIFCPNCHKRFGMAVKQEGMIEVRTGPEQRQLTVSEDTATQMFLQCRYCGKPVSLTKPCEKVAHA